jgi:N-dimethylarginine dimethylaminohydrolase
MPKSVLVCPPTYFDVIDMKNPYMVGQSPVDRAKAGAQWDRLRNALEAAGVKVEIVDPVPGLEDMVFAANQVFVGYGEKIGKFIVPSRMRHASRQREVVHYVEWFRQRDYKILQVEFGDEYLEGGGDLIWHPVVTPALSPANVAANSSRIYAGYGFRSTRGGVRRFTQVMSQFDIEVLPLELADARFYHLDTCFCPLNHEAVLFYPGAFIPSSLGVLRNCWHRLYEISESEAVGFVANGIVAGQNYLTSRLTPNLDNILHQENLRPVVIDTSEFEKSGGSCYCMKNFLE